MKPPKEDLAIFKYEEHFEKKYLSEGSTAFKVIKTGISWAVRHEDKLLSQLVPELGFYIVCPIPQ